MYFLPFATSLVAAALIWQWIYEPVYGFLNYVARRWSASAAEVAAEPDAGAARRSPLISVWVRIGFDTMIFLAALQAIPEEYYEAAAIDGARAVAELLGTSRCPCSTRRSSWSASSS